MRIAYLTPLELGKSSAGLARVLGVSSALAHAGHEVVVSGQGGGAEAPTSRYRGVSLIPYEGHSDRVGHSGRLRLRSALPVENWLSDLKARPDLLIVYGGSGLFTRAVKSWANQSGVRRVIDSVEWYDRGHMLGGAWGIRALDNEVSMRWRYPKYDAAIAISRFLEEYYLLKGLKVLRVPPIIDVLSLPAPITSLEGPLRLLYAGTPGKKDELATVIGAVGDVDPEGQYLRLDVLGLTGSELALLVGGQRMMPAAVSAHGRVTRDEVLQRLASADYVPLLRPNRRFAEAGFPTKVVEAMSAGTAVMANLTSDLELHLRHLQNGIVVASNTRIDMARALDTAIEGGRTMSMTLGSTARAEALGSFDFRNYSRHLSDFVESVNE